MTVIVTDHHDIPYREEEDGSRTALLPPADVIVNPKQADCPYPFKKLCGAAVAWRLAEALYRPRIPDKGRHLQYNLSMPASSYVEDDIATMRRICKEEDFK